MASPIAHSFAGSWIFLYAERAKLGSAGAWRRYLPQLCTLVLLANLPDFDFLLQLATGTDVHRGFSHSLAAAVLVAIGLAAFWRITAGFWRSALLYFTAYGSHLLIDYFTGSSLGWTHSGSGIPLWSPFFKANFSSPLILVYGVRHGAASSLLSTTNLWSALYEFLVFGALTLVAVGCSARYVLKRGNVSPRSGGASYVLQPDASDLK